MSRALAPWLLWALAYALLQRLNPESPVVDDNVRDLLMARDCVELDHCHLLGPQTSVPGLFQGAVWPNLLAIGRLLGADARTMLVAVLAALAATVPLLFVTARSLAPRLALPAALWLLFGLSLDDGPAQLINPTLAPCWALAVSLPLWRYAAAPRWRHLLVAALLLSLGVGTHVALVALVPALLVLPLLLDPRPWASAAWALGLLIVGYALISPAAAVANTQFAATHAALFVLLLAPLLARRLAERALALDPCGRGGLLLALVLLPYLLGLTWLIALAHHAYGLTYLAPILPALALLLALGARLAAAPLPSLPRRVLLLAVPLALLAWTQRPQRPPSRLTWPDVERLARVPLVAQTAHAQRLRRVQGGACRELVAGLGLLAPPPVPGVESQRALRIVLSAAPLPAAATATQRVELGGGRWALVDEIASWLDTEHARTCRQAVRDRAPPHCQALPTLAAEAARPEAFLFSNRAFPQTDTEALPPPYRLTWEVPLRPVDARRRLVLMDEDADGCGWQFSHVAGVAVHEALPARAVTLVAAGLGTGTLVLTKRLDRPACRADVADRHYPPCLVELRDGEAWLAAIPTVRTP